MRPRVEARRADDAPFEELIRLAEEADRSHAENGRRIGKRLLREAAAADREHRDRELDRRRDDEQRAERGEPPPALGRLQRQQRPPLEREIEQIAPDDRVDAEERHAPDVEVPVLRRGERPQRGDDEDEENGEDDVHPPVPAADRPSDQEQERREQEIEPLLDRKAPGDGVEVDRVGRTKKILDVEEIAQRVRRQEVAGHQRDNGEGRDIGRDGAHPAPGEKDAEVAPGSADHPVDDLGREHEAAEDEEDFDAGDGDRFRGRLERRVGRQVMRDRHREGRRAAQKIQRSAALHFGE